MTDTGEMPLDDAGGRAARRRIIERWARESLSPLEQVELQAAFEAAGIGHIRAVSDSTVNVVAHSRQRN